MDTDLPPEEQQRMVEEPMDHSPSSSATDPEHAAQDQDVELYTNRYGYTENQTVIGGDLPSKSDSDRETLNQLHKESTESDHKQVRQRISDFENDLRAWGRRIELSDFEIERALYLFEHVDETMREGDTTEAAILAALTMAANEEMTSEPQKIIRRSAEQIAKQSEDLEWYSELIDHYENLREELNVSQKAVKRGRKSIRQSV